MKNIIIVALILGFIGVVVLLDIPGVQEVLGLKKQIENQKKVLEEKQNLINTVEGLRSEYENNKETLDKLDYIVPGKQEIPNLIVQIEAIAAKGGLVLGEMRFKTEEKSSEKYNTLIIELSLSGDYASFEKFLSTIEENIRLMDVESITFTSAESEGASLFNFGVIFNAYYQ